ncbi:MAG: CheR family methyltransferase [Gemmatimonadaceae bacterium]
MRRRTGLVFGATRRSAFDEALSAAMRRATANDPEVYLDRLSNEPALLDDLVADITVGETYFFREPQQLAVFRNSVLPALVSERATGEPLRVWSAGCASGEEPYTLAIILHEQQLAQPAHIIGTDLSRAALAQARRARYTRWSLRGVSSEVTKTYFKQAGDRFILAPKIREAVDFRYLNLAEDSYPSLPTGIWGMNLILCRNVLIYFDAETVARVARRLLDALSDDGWLLLGASDPVLSDLVPCDVVVTEAGLAYRRRGRRAVRLGAGPASRSAAISTPALPAFPEVERFEPQSSPPLAPPFPEAAPEAAPPAVAVALAAADGVAEALVAYAARDYVRAAELAGGLVQRGNADPALQVVLVRALANRGELDAAGRACAAALDVQRTSAELTYLHAVLLSEAGRYSDAAVAARRALYLDGGFVAAHLALGGALARLGEIDGAKRAYRNAERLLNGMSPTETVPSSDGELAGRLAEIARLQRQLLAETAA